MLLVDLFGRLDRAVAALAASSRSNGMQNFGKPNAVACGLAVQPICQVVGADFEPEPSRNAMGSDGTVAAEKARWAKESIPAGSGLSELLLQRA